MAPDEWALSSDVSKRGGNLGTQGHQECAHAEERACEDTVRRWPPASQEESPGNKPGNKPAGTLITDLPASGMLKSNYMLFKHPSLWYYVIAT